MHLEGQYYPLPLVWQEVLCGCMAVWIAWLSGVCNLWPGHAQDSPRGHVITISYSLALAEVPFFLHLCSDLAREKVLHLVSSFSSTVTAVQFLQQWSTYSSVLAVVKYLQFSSCSGEVPTVQSCSGEVPTVQCLQWWSTYSSVLQQWSTYSSLLAVVQ